MEARAINRYVGTSPTKMRLVVDLIRGRGVEDALNVLHFSPKHAARTAEKTLRSAISNLQNKDESGKVDTATLFVKAAFVDGGPTLKRISPAPMGRAYRIRKRSHHLTVIVAQRTEPAAQAPKPTKAGKSAATAKAAPKATPKKKSAAKKPKKKTSASTTQKKKKASTKR